MKGSNIKITKPQEWKIVNAVFAAISQCYSRSLKRMSEIISNVRREIIQQTERIQDWNAQLLNNWMSGYTK